VKKLLILIFLAGCGPQPQEKKPLVKWDGYEGSVTAFLNPNKKTYHVILYLSQENQYYVGELNPLSEVVEKLGTTWHGKPTQPSKNVPGK